MKVRKESFFLEGKNRERYSSDTVGCTLSRRPNLLFRKIGIYPHVKSIQKKLSISLVIKEDPMSSIQYDILFCQVYPFTIIQTGYIYYTKYTYAHVIVMRMLD